MTVDQADQIIQLLQAISISLIVLVCWVAFFGTLYVMRRS